ncbi:tRNA-uridine aminocarboxypropyltransferase [Anaeromyxobacter diazotrophicus]|uniref:tRNA-uridine aminocarboxypropyltransferase n=1 Tax=Anaeromyxobacter diazotrophicus TaxID=2590199 RepID=A0A7I9VPX3_9BACT|nr:tRNA-uridine aminocarboxypropyltransferase [Anaeromyxobacter diazotrophicus]GEJ58170.1 DTW domain-containing protein [Anaeromyxobacter diazotrophicus]
MRRTCRRCLRPESFCVCDGVVPVQTRTRVVLLQHPREARLAICSAWLTRIALENAELHRGVRFEDDARVTELASAPGAALLYPGGDSAASRAGAPPPILFVVDGTWVQAEKMLAANPRLSALPRLAIAPPAPSGYAGLRREPSAHCLSTLEAVAYALADLEGGAARFEPMRAAFRRMVELQLACSRDGRRAPRHRAPARPRGEAAGSGG